MKPLAIETLCYYYYPKGSNRPENGDHVLDPDSTKQISYLVDEGLLTSNPGQNTGIYEITDKGRYLVEYLTTIPTPIEIYTIEGHE